MARPHGPGTESRTTSETRPARFLLAARRGWLAAIGAAALIVAAAIVAGPRAGAGDTRGGWFAAGIGPAAPHVAVAIVAGPRAGAGVARAQAAPPASHPAMGMDARESYERATTLVRDRRSVDALPYFDRAAALRPDVWVGQVDYASALFNSAFEARTRRGRLGTWTRSSVERAELMRRAWHRLEIAPALAPGAVELAYGHELRGRLLRTWGLSHDARIEFALAAQRDPTNTAAAAASLHLAQALGFARPPRGLAP